MERFMFSKRGWIEQIGMLCYLLLSSCGNQAADDVWHKAGRYAVQFVGIVTAKAHEPIPIQLAFIDVGTPRRTSEPQFNQLTIVSDQGELTTQSVTLSPSPATANSRFFSVLAMLDGLNPGSYHFSQIRYLDEQQREQTITVGDWELTVLDLPIATLKLGSHSVVTMGRAERFEAELINPTDQAIQLFASSIKGTKYPISATLHIAQTKAVASQPMLGDAPPQPLSTVEVTMIDLQPKQSQNIIFQLHGIEQLPTDFLAIQPTINYKQGQTVAQTFILPLQVFSPPFNDDLAVKKYLDFLPVSAFHE